MEEQRLWYVVNTYSGWENKVKEKLEMRSKSMDMKDYIFQVIVPEQYEVLVQDGVRKERSRKLFPGYVLIEMIMTNEAWYIVRNTPGVTGFIGSSGKGAKPIPLQPDEVDKIIGNRLTTTYKSLKIGNKVTIKGGPFKGMSGIIVSRNDDIITVEVDLFGQDTPIELSINQL